MNIRRRLKRRPRLTWAQRMLSSYRPIGFLQNRPALLRALVASGAVGRVEGFRMVENEDLR